MYLDRFDSLYISVRDKRWAKTPEELAFLHHGIPKNFWHCKPAKFVTLDSRINDRIKTVDQDDQENFWNILRSKWGSKLVCIGSNPTDDAALRTAFSLQKHILRKGEQAYAVDVNNPYAPAEVPDCLVVFNIVSEAVTVEQIAFIRGCLYSYSGSARIVVVSGDPLKFMLEKVHSRVNGIFYHYDRKILEI